MISGYLKGAQRGPQTFGNHVFVLLTIIFAFAVIDRAAAQSDRETERRRENNSTVMIAAGRPDTSLMQIANDLSIIFKGTDDGFRVVPVVGNGTMANVRDLVLLRNIDLALTDLTVLNWMNQSKEISPALFREVAHVVTLFPDKLSVLARSDLNDITELDGKRVSVGLKGSTEAMHAEFIFRSLNINANLTYLASTDSAEALTKGDIDAFVCFCLASPTVYQRVMFDPDIKLLPIPFATALQQDYGQSSLSHEDFPSFIKQGETVETLAVELTLVTYNWQKGSPRYTRVAKFVEQFLNDLSKLRLSPRHKGWRVMQVSDDTPIWPRFAAVTEWQNSNKNEALQEMRVAFGEFLNQWKPTSVPVVSTEQTQLFEEFLAWQDRSSR
jgi:TRAP-type uncharacterized transport system substrate-binding protein